MPEAITDEMLGYYAYSYLSLGQKNYRKAISGFNFTLSRNIEPEKSAIGLICAYSCLGNYMKALKVYDRYKDSIIFNTKFRHQLVKDMSYFLAMDTFALRLQRKGYFSSITLGRSMNRTHAAYMADTSNIAAIILISYWYIFTGHEFNDIKKITDACLYLPTLDDTFRWKLLNRAAIDDSSLLQDESLAALFTMIPGEVASNEYINTIILSMLYGGDLEKARNNIEIYRLKGLIFTNELMWNFIRLSVEEDEIDDLSINFAKHLISEGWADSLIAAVIRFGYANRSRYSVKKELNKLTYFNL
ncbi:MAG: hypothetical protein R6W99_04755 [Clostridia bacterium]